MALPLELRTRIVETYLETPGATYDSIAERFKVGSATVNRLLRLKRETGGLVPGKSRGRTPVIDAAWLERSMQTNSDLRVLDRVAAYQFERGITVSESGMWRAIRRLGYTHKKRHPKQPNKTDWTSRKSADAS